MISAGLSSLLLLGPSHLLLFLGISEHSFAEGRWEHLLNDVGRTGSGPHDLVLAVLYEVVIEQEYGRGADKYEDDDGRVDSRGVGDVASPLALSVTSGVLESVSRLFAYYY